MTKGQLTCPHTNNHFLLVIFCLLHFEPTTCFTTQVTTPPMIQSVIISSSISRSNKIFTPLPLTNTCSSSLSTISRSATTTQRRKATHIKSTNKSSEVVNTDDTNISNDDLIDREHSSADVSELASAVQDDDDLPLHRKITKKVKNVFSNKEDDGLTFKQKLGKMGMSALLSYGFVSNMSYAVSVSLAWYGFTKKTGLSPLAPGQWKPFLAVYAGFYVFNNIVRPMRLAVAVGVTKYFDAVINFFQTKLKCNRAVAVGLTVFMGNVVGTISAMCLGISLASAASGVPIFVRKGMGGV
mmetsp:Transcript_30022/g.36597  ORF Transcript_30022/g.36597 Transcript_30022/m.36597 type:complete len:297 (+) Transcript_30022:58-948(+)